MFGDNLRKYRELRGMTQTELGKLLNVSFKTISHWECDYTEPSLGSLRKMTEVLHVSYVELLDK